MMLKIYACNFCIILNFYLFLMQMQPNPDATTHGDHNYSFQTPIQNSPITKNQTLSSKNMKSASTQMVRFLNIILYVLNEKKIVLIFEI